MNLFILSLITIVGAFVTWCTLYALHACGAPRKRLCARAHLMQLHAWAARVCGVRGARCAPLAACAWRSSPRPLTRSYIGARLPASSYPLLSFTHRTKLPVFLVFFLLSRLLLHRLCIAHVSASSPPFARCVRLQHYKICVHNFTKSTLSIMSSNCENDWYRIRVNCNYNCFIKNMRIYTGIFKKKYGNIWHF